MLAGDTVVGQVVAAHLHGSRGVAIDDPPALLRIDDAGADVVLNGHAHNYQRFGPQTPSGAADSRGIREFVVGTGGNSHHRVGLPIPNQETVDDTTYGVLRLLLLDTDYRWQFVPQSGGIFADSGTAACH